MSFWSDGLKGMRAANGFNAVLKHHFIAGLQKTHAVIDDATKSLMVGRGRTAFNVAAVVFDLGEREFSQEALRNYLGNVLKMEQSTVERAIACRFPKDDQPPLIVSAIVRREIQRQEEGSISGSNLDKYLRGFEIAGFIERTRTKHGSEMAYRLTEKGKTIEDLVNEHLQKKDAAE